MFSELHWDFSDQVNVILGRNGYGKTLMPKILTSLLSNEPAVRFNQRMSGIASTGIGATVLVISPLLQVICGSWHQRSPGCPRRAPSGCSPRVSVVARAIDMPFFRHLPLSADLKAKVEASGGAVAARGCADASLYRRMHHAGLTDVKRLPQLAVFDRSEPTFLDFMREADQVRAG
jgi:hypothetical protein